MPFNFDNLPSRRETIMWNKWTNYPPDVLPMWVADTDFPTAPQIQKAIHRQTAQGVFGYEAPSKLYLTIIADRMKKLYNWEVDPDSIVYTAGVNNGYNIAARILCTPKRGYLIQTPVYNEFLDTERKTGVKQHTAPLEKMVEGNRIRYEVGWEAFETAAKKSAMFLLCHPHNPVGKIYSRKELKRMAEVCLANNVTMISDEIHSEILLGGAKFMPLASLSREIAKHTITLISASKAYNVPGLACAFAIIPDEKLRQRFVEVGNGMSIEMSSVGLTAARVAFGGKADAWLRAANRYLKSNRDFVLKFIEENIPAIRTTKPDATYLLWLDCSALNLKPTPYEFFLKEAKVALSDGGRFGKGSEQFVRLNYGTSRKRLVDGLERMRRALK